MLKTKKEETGLTLCNGHDPGDGHNEVLCLLVGMVRAVDVGQGANWRKSST